LTIRLVPFDFHCESDAAALGTAVLAGNSSRYGGFFASFARPSSFSHAMVRSGIFTLTSEVKKFDLGESIF